MFIVTMLKFSNVQMFKCQMSIRLNFCKVTTEFIRYTELSLLADIDILSQIFGVRDFVMSDKYNLMDIKAWQLILSGFIKQKYVYPF